MLLHSLRTIALLGAAACIALAAYCGVNNIRSLDDFRNYREMRNVDTPIVTALARGELPAGSSAQKMLAIEQPQWSKAYGRYVVYGFSPKGSYDYITAVAVDDRLTAAHAGSCTWQWSFYDETPDDVATAVRNMHVLRDTIDRMPELTQYLQPSLDEQLQFLGMKDDETNESN